ncbi:hypothetical protein [Azospirillum sp. sgz302134]
MTTAPTAGAFLLFGLTALAPVGVLAEQPLTVRGSDCRVWDQYPDSRKTVQWSGGCRNGWADGPGLLVWFYDGRYDGQVEGTFVEGRLEGPARVVWRDGRRLDGTFRHGRASGQGTYVWPDGRTYQGEWQDDHRTGFGTLTFPNGNRYVGTFTRNRPSGQGKFLSADGQRFEARVDPRGNIVAGPPLDQPPDRPPQSAALPPSQPLSRPPGQPSNPPERLEDWLSGSASQPRASPR